MTKGFINSIQSMGTLDGPGVRFVVFAQGCNLRCGCCHNPDTWSLHGGKEFLPEEIVEKAMRFREYFGNEGGITISGGEPLLQAGFVREVFELCHASGINTCLDTSGSIINDDVIRMLEHCDRVLLDIKYATDEMYREYVGCGIETPLAFLDLLNEKGIAVTLRQVIIPTLNDDTESINFLNKIISEYKCIDKVELLPFKKICKAKYDNLGIPFRFESFSEPSASCIDKLQSILTL
ncbi:MAG: pyruvate formate lyase-activating protein [Ruminococcaceae bacterium]|nr:pyruvate formate lyase-activating protein [Oscillospiraceae bacterium]